MATVTIRNVHKNYADFHAVKGVSLEVKDHEFVVLVGPSGCGKTTTLRMVAGLESITQGDILIGDTIVNNLPPMDRDIAMVFQNYALYPHMSIYDNMAFGLKMRKFDKAEITKRVNNAADILDIKDHLASQAAHAVGRPAPARRLGARHRAQSAGVSVRRTLVEPRRQAARADAHRDQEAAPAAGDHVALRDPRSGRGDDARRPRRRHEGRPDPAGRRTLGTLQHAGQQVRRGLHRLAGDEFFRGEYRLGERRALSPRTPP